MFRNRRSKDMRITILFLLLASSTTITSLKRVKRIFNGEPVIGRDTPYHAVKYFGAIATPYGVARGTRKISAELLKQDKLYGKIKCGGALLTVEVVQTACHCLSTWDTRNAPIKRPIINHQWENSLVVYVGVNDVFGLYPSMYTVDPIYATKFFIHMKCGKISKGKGLNVHDFGYIRVKPDWFRSHANNIPVSALDFAPLLVKKQITKLYIEMLNEEQVCLHIGFGIWDVDHPTRQSDYLRHGWGVLMNYVACHKLLFEGITNKSYYQTEATWYCSVNFHAHKQASGKGDSGGPITCNNHYVAVASAVLEKSFKLIRRFRAPDYIESEFMTVVDPLYFAIFENAANYRKSFIYYVNNFDKGVSYKDAIRQHTEKKRSVRRRGRIFQEMLVSASTSIKISTFIFCNTIIVFGCY